MRSVSETAVRIARLFSCCQPVRPAQPHRSPPHCGIAALLHCRIPYFRTTSQKSDRSASSSALPLRSLQLDQASPIVSTLPHCHNQWCHLGERVEGSDEVEIQLAEACQVQIYDPTLGVEPIRDLTAADSIKLAVSDHPYVLTISRK